MKLFYSPGACSLAVHIALIEAGVNHKLEKTDLRKKEYSGGDYLNINPKGSVPALEISNGTILTEAAVCLQYVADQKPEKNLIPRPGTWERYRAQEWLNFVSTEIHKGFGPLWKPNFSDDAKNAVREQMTPKLEYLQKNLANHPFLMGEQYTVADAYLFTVMRWTGHLKVDVSKYPAILGHSERVKSRPAVAEALKTEGLA